MKKLAAISIALIVLVLAYTVGRRAGIRHAIDTLQLYAIEHGAGYNARVLIDFDGQIHSYTAD